MPLNTLNFTTGPATLPDVGTLSYNSCLFSPLFETSINGEVVEDNAHRTVKWLEITLTADGYVTLPTGDRSVSRTMMTLVRLLTAPAGVLLYTGRGFDLNINTSAVSGANNALSITEDDLAWGPMAKLLEFQPLGGGLSAKVKWQVRLRVPNIRKGCPKPLLQFSSESVVTYNEDGFSTLSIKGVLEIPLTRFVPGERRTSQNGAVADTYRSYLESRIFAGIDLSRFRVTRRNFPMSNDKRFLTWDIVVEEKPYMDLPPTCTIARGSYKVRPVTAGAGLAMWFCTLSATYTIAKGKPRRLAWLAFLALLRLRMSQSVNANLAADPNQLPNLIQRANINNLPGIGLGLAALDIIRQLRAILDQQRGPVAASQRAWLIDFSFDEGLYLDSKTTSFSATWQLATNFDSIIAASGLWKKVPETDAQGNNLWAASMRNIQGSRSWLGNYFDPSLDVIVDFGYNSQPGGV